MPALLIDQLTAEQLTLLLHRCVECRVVGKDWHTTAETLNYPEEEIRLLIIRKEKEYRKILRNTRNEHADITMVAALKTVQQLIQQPVERLKTQAVNFIMRYAAEKYRYQSTLRKTAATLVRNESRSTPRNTLKSSSDLKKNPAAIQNSQSSDSSPGDLSRQLQL